MRFFSRLNRDYYAGALMVLCGAIAAQDARNYRVGTLHQMGPGYFPLALGIILMALGVIIAGTAGSGSEEPTEAMPRSEWRGWFFILLGPALFIVFGTYGGMLPGTFACVFASALGDRQTSLKAALGLAAAVTVFGVLLFSYVLNLPMPVLHWGRS